MKDSLLIWIVSSLCLLATAGCKQDSNIAANGESPASARSVFVLADDGGTRRLHTLAVWPDSMSIVAVDTQAIDAIRQDGDQVFAQRHSGVTSLLIGHSPSDLQKISTLDYKVVDYVVNDRYLLVISSDKLYAYPRSGKDYAIEPQVLTFDEYKGLAGRVPDLISIAMGPGNRCFYIVDRALDRIYHFGIRSAVDEVYPLQQEYLPLTQGCGPLQVDFHTDEERFYVLCGAGNKIIAGEYIDSTCVLQKRASLQSTPIGLEGNITVDLTLSEDGRFLYVANKEAGTIGVYTVDRGMALSFLQFLQLPLPGMLHILAVDNSLLISSEEAGTVYRAIHTVGLTMAVVDSVALDSPSQLIGLH